MVRQAGSMTHTLIFNISANIAHIFEKSNTLWCVLKKCQNSVAKKASQNCVNCVTFLGFPLVLRMFTKKRHTKSVPQLRYLGRFFDQLFLAPFVQI
jgi:hypothetical protein